MHLKELRYSAVLNTLAHLFVAVLIGVLSVVIRLAVSLSPFPPVPYNLAGLIFLIAGFIFRFKAIRLFNRKGIRFKHSHEPVTLFTEGVYKYSRNPMYLGIVLMILGSTVLFTTSIMIVIMTGTAFLVLRSYIIDEETHLRAKFKEYVDYENKTRRWL
jgi:protein-S-isoprenylcysteine O-methyltransferase Ste14